MSYKAISDQQMLC